MRKLLVYCQVGLKLLGEVLVALGDALINTRTMSARIHGRRTW
jgi:hypothetical protein